MWPANDALIRSACVYQCVCVTGLTQHNQVDLAPVVPPPGFDLAGVLPRVGQQQVADQQRGVAAQVLAGEGEAGGISARRLVGVHLTPEEGNDLQTREEKESRGVGFSTTDASLSC